MAIFFDNVQRVIYKFYQFFGFNRFHYILCPKIHCVKLWQIIFIALIFKFINFVDDFKSFKSLFGVNWRTCL